jgi:hypothetical protein
LPPSAFLKRPWQRLSSLSRQRGKSPPTQLTRSTGSGCRRLRRRSRTPLAVSLALMKKAVRANGDATMLNLQDLLSHLREAASRRNLICHGSWRIPDDQGRSIPFYVDKKRGVWETPVGVAHLAQLRQHVAELSCAVVNSVTQMGYQFPGSKGPGKPVFEPQLDDEHGSTKKSGV